MIWHQHRKRVMADLPQMPQTITTDLGNKIKTQQLHEDPAHRRATLSWGPSAQERCSAQAEREAAMQAIAEERAVAESSAAAADERGRALDAQVVFPV